MATRLPLLTIENILRDYLHPFRCDCHAQQDSHLTVRLYEEHDEVEELTVFGITDDQCRDAANLVRLAQELRFELYATRSGMPVAVNAAKVAER
jgi:benzoyl-CoA reductase/2-hydroxyglutaryl-CoA dehydratase subunit BcrC/BadD/HgdB